jgi:hypothetical protein
MLQPEEEQIHADAYIDSLLSRPISPRLLDGTREPPLDGTLQRTIEALAAMPRFHPSFAFEESLAARLREAAGGPLGGLAEIIRLPLARPAQETLAGIDRRLLVGGAIASGVSLAGLAGVAMAWRQRAR